MRRLNAFLKDLHDFFMIANKYLHFFSLILDKLLYFLAQTAAFGPGIIFL